MVEKMLEKWTKMCKISLIVLMIVLIIVSLFPNTTASAAGLDFTFNFFGTNKDSYNTGETVNLWATIMNTGTVEIDAAIADFSIVSPSGQTVFTDKNSNSYIKPNSLAPISTAWTIPNNVDSGQYTAKVTITSRETPSGPYVTKSNSYTFKVNAPQVPQQPDFIVNDISWTPSTIKEGDTVTFNVKFSNIGTGGSTTWFYNNYYIDGQYVDQDGAGTTTGDPSQIHSGDFSWKATSSGWHTVKMVTDATNLIAESNENNNAMEKSFYVNPAPVITGTITVNTNLASASFTFTGASTYSGSGTSWSTTNAPAGTYTITYGAVTGYNTPPSETKTLSGGGSITFSGTYSTQVQQKPDFIVNDISWTPTTIKEGDTVTFNVKFSNIGTGGSTTWFYNNYYIDGQYVDQDGAGTTAGDPSQIHQGDFSWKATSSGWHTVKMVTDATNLIAESNENNNAMEKSFYVSATSPPPIQNPTFGNTYISPSSVLPGQSFTGYFVISNPNSNSINVGLGLSIRRSGTTTEIVDKSNDVVISAAPGTNTYSRTFTVSSSASVGSYDVAQAIWSGSPGTGTQYATSGWKSGALTISAPIQQSLSISVSPTSTTIDSGSSASFSITVTDQNGNGVSSATIGIEDSAKVFSTSVTTNNYGSATYSTNPISSGYVYFTATKSGYTSSSKTSAYITVQQAIQSPTLSDTYISPSSVLLGQSFTGYYVINNPNSNSMNVGLGLSIRRSGTTGEIVDTSNDAVISAAPGTNTYSRTFTVSSSASVGSYDVAQAIWSGSPGTGTQYATSGWKSGALTISSPQTVSTYLTLEVKPSIVNKSDNVEFWARLFDSSGSVVLGKTIKFYISGNYIGSDSNYATGWVTQTYTANLNQGSYEVKVVFDGDSQYASSYKTQTLTVASPQHPSASIQSASVDKSSYNPGETVNISVIIYNTGTVDLSGLKINVDIADPNGNNVKATTLQSGISLSAGQSYFTGYISYYTIPGNPISGTYKVTVGLWNSDNSKNYDIKYQITSFNVNGDTVGVNQVYYIPPELYNLIVKDNEKLKNSLFFVEGSWKTLKPDSKIKNSIYIVHQISDDRKTIYVYDKAVGAKKYEQVKVKIKVFDKNDEPVRGIDVYENIKLTDVGLFIIKPLSCQIEAITQDDINKLRDYILIQLLSFALPEPLSFALPEDDITLRLEDYIERYGTCTEEWAYLKIGSTNNEGFIETWVRSDIPIPYYKFAVRDDLSCVKINELMDKKIGETELIPLTNPKEIEIKAVPKVGIVTGSTGKEWSKNIENFIQKNNLLATHEENSNILLKSTDYDIFIYLITPTDITERRPYDYSRYYHFNPTIDYYQNKGVIKFGDATYDSPSNGLISCYYSDHSLKYMIAGLGEEGFKTALNGFYEGKVNTVVKSPIQEKQYSSKSIIDTISNFFKGIFGW